MQQHEESLRFQSQIVRVATPAPAQATTQYMLTCDVCKVGSCCLDTGHGGQCRCRSCD